MSQQTIEDILPHADLIRTWSKHQYERGEGSNRKKYLDITLIISLNGEKRDEETLKQLLLDTEWSIDSIKNGTFSNKTTYRGTLANDRGETNTYSLSIKVKGIDNMRTRLALHVNCTATQQTAADNLVSVMKAYVAKVNSN
ncbi:MAG: hypothetical protein V1725_07455 [archaeon]